MKKIWFVSLIFLAGQNLPAQESVLTFHAKGAATTIDSIVATNKITGNQVKATEADTIHLSSIVTAVNSIHNASNDISVYPNPFPGKTELHYFSKQEDALKIILTNPTGHIVDTKNCFLVQGTHKFEISGTMAGVYIVSITGASGVAASFKLMCLQENSGKDQIRYSGISGKTFPEKSAVLEEGQLVHFRVYSDNRITVIADSPTTSKTYEVEFLECIDKDGKSYAVVQIGDQWWMAENLAYLPDVSPSSEGSNTEPLYYVYDYQGTSVQEAKATDNYKTYGVLYNWPAALESSPGGWHLPTDAEWEQLAQYVSEQKGPYTRYNLYWNGVGKHLKATNGWNDDGNGTDDFGFSGIPGGYGYINYFHRFDVIGNTGAWWSATQHKGDSIWYRDMSHRNETFERRYFYKENGFTVRCIKD